MSGLLARLFLPEDNTCLICSRALQKEEHLLCGKCVRSLQSCRIPEKDLSVPGEWKVCSAFYHTGPARELVHLLKFSSVPLAAAVLAGPMAEAATVSGLARGANLIVPVPISSARRRVRGFNQSAALARELSRLLGIPADENALRRERDLSSQVGRDRRERLEAMKDVFRADGVWGKTVLLVDDVFTTGATGEACARAMLAAGAWEVRLVTANRV